MERKAGKKRNFALDILKVFAAFLVVMLHCTAFYIVLLDSGTWGYRLCRMLNSLARMGVPIFVMVSGAIFLNQERTDSVKRIWIHTILRLVIVYLVWAFVYDARKIWDAIFSEHSLVHALEILVDEPYHFWFLPMIIGLYALVPILRTWISHAEKKEIRYFLILYFVVQILRETGQRIFSGYVAEKIFQFVSFEVICNYLGYYVLGYYIVRFGLAGRVRKAFLWAAVPCVLAGYFYSDPFVLFTFVPVVALFTVVSGGERLGVVENGTKQGEVARRGSGMDETVRPESEDMQEQSCGMGEAGGSEAKWALRQGKNEIFMRNVNIRIVLQRLVSWLAKDTLGIYLMHLLFLTFYNRILMDGSALPAEWKAVIMTVLCFVSSGIVTGILRRIPIVGRYLV